MKLYRDMLNTPDGQFKFIVGHIRGKDRIVASGFNEDFAVIISKLNRFQREHLLDGDSVLGDPDVTLEEDIAANLLVDRDRTGYVRTAVAAYYFGAVTYVTKLPVWNVGTDLQVAVRDLMRRIEPGKTISYGNIAKLLGVPKLSRAVANACATNPIPLFQPCHRVTAANGLGGFRYGAEMKMRLLAHERESVENGNSKRSPLEIIKNLGFDAEA